MKEAIARIRTVRISPRKVRLVLDLVRGKKVAEAISILESINKKSKTIVLDLLHSAITNAVNNHSMNGESLFIKEAIANEGPTLKRFRPRAQGRAFPINKRTSHILLKVAERE